MAERRRWWWMVAAAWLCASAAWSSQGPRAWIGHEVPPWPPGLTSNSGACVSTEVGPCTVKVHLLHDAAGRAFLASALDTLYEQPGQARWQLRDIIAVPPRQPGHVLVLGSCSYLDRFAGARMAAIVAPQGDKQPGRVVWAVYLAPADLGFHPARLSRVECSPAHGQD